MTVTMHPEEQAAFISEAEFQILEAFGANSQWTVGDAALDEDGVGTLLVWHVLGHPISIRVRYGIDFADGDLAKQLEEIEAARPEPDPYENMEWDFLRQLSKLLIYCVIGIGFYTLIGWVF